MTDQYIPLNEAMHRLGISKATMAKLVKAGDIPYVTSKLDKRKKLVLISDVEKLIQEPFDYPDTPPGSIANINNREDIDQ